MYISSEHKNTLISCRRKGHHSSALKRSSSQKHAYTYWIAMYKELLSEATSYRRQCGHCTVERSMPRDQQGAEKPWLPPLDQRSVRVCQVLKHISVN